jgi:hypothetical protein
MENLKVRHNPELTEKMSASIIFNQVLLLIFSTI